MVEETAVTREEKTEDTEMVHLNKNPTGVAWHGMGTVIIGMMGDIDPTVSTTTQSTDVAETSGDNTGGDEDSPNQGGQHGSNAHSSMHDTTSSGGFGYEICAIEARHL